MIVLLVERPDMIQFWSKDYHQNATNQGFQIIKVFLWMSPQN